MKAKKTHEMVSSSSALATTLSQLALAACWPGTSAFAPHHLAARPSAGLRSNHHGENRLYRIHCPSPGGVQYPSMRASTPSEDAVGGLELMGHEEGGGRASTRLDFGVSLGAIAAALLMGGYPRQALAKDAATEGGEGAATAVATVAAVSAEQAEAAPVAAAAAVDAPALRDLGFEVPYAGKMVPLNKFLGGKATLVVNPKIDDPESLHQVGWCEATVAQHQSNSSSNRNVDIRGMNRSPTRVQQQ